MRKWIMTAACGIAFFGISQGLIDIVANIRSDPMPAGNRVSLETAEISPDRTSLPAPAPAAQQSDGDAAPAKHLNQMEETARWSEPAQAERQEIPALFGVSLGDPVERVETVLGAPARRDPAPFGYEWLIYNRDPARYVQVGIAHGRVVDLFSNSASAELGRVRVGTSYEALTRLYPPTPTVVFTHRGTEIRITNQPQERPLVMLGGAPVIFYLDKQNGSRVTAIRMIGIEQLLVGGYYETSWLARKDGPSFDPPVLTIKEREAVDEALARQLLDLANAVRYRYKLPLLTWNERAAAAAQNHSRDMAEGDYFDHISPRTGLDPFERLREAGIHFRLAGENIAAGFPDAIEAHESWMNSPGHRKNILEKSFTQLGAGVHADFYTQNFVTPR